MVKVQKPFFANKELFATERVGENAELRARIAGLTEADYTRLPAFAEREEIQRMLSNFHCFQQQLSVHSLKLRKFVLNVWLSVRMNCHKKNTMLSLLKSLMNGLNGKKKLDLTFLFMVSLNVMTWLSTSARTCQVTSSLKMVGFNHTVCVGVKPPIIWGDVTRLNPITVKWSSYAQSRTDKPVKGMLTGPVTILNWSFPREDISIKDSTLQIALAIKDEVLDLEGAGVKIIKLTKALFVKNCHSVVVTGMRITSTGQFQLSVWYTQL